MTNRSRLALIRGLIAGIIIGTGNGIIYHNLNTSPPKPKYRAIISVFRSSIDSWDLTMTAIISDKLRKHDAKLSVHPAGNAILIESDDEIDQNLHKLDPLIRGITLIPVSKP